mmetsp:Transcript_1296/g.2331  ORF Transcript_1296/g.2331 Transcript_1296/m.2331 type:complete len:211 (-) Transcript_1296:100-732(-)
MPCQMHDGRGLFNMCIIYFYRIIVHRTMLENVLFFTKEDTSMKFIDDGTVGSSLLASRYCYSMINMECLDIIIDRDQKFHGSHSWGTHFGGNQKESLQRTKKDERHHTCRIGRNLPAPSNQERSSCEFSRVCCFGNKLAHCVVLQNGSDRCCPRSAMLSFDKQCLSCYVRDRMCSRYGASFFLRFHLRFGRTSQYRVLLRRRTRVVVPPS